MNKTVNPASTTRGAAPVPLPPDIQKLIQPHLGAPDAEANIADTVRTQYRQNHPSFAEAEAVAEEADAQLALLRADRKRHTEAKDTADLVRERFVGSRPDPLARFDRLQFIGTAIAGVLGVVTACHGLASYVSDSSVIASLSDNYPGALLISGAPVTGAFLLKARGALEENDKDERRYYRRLAGYGVIVLTLHILSLSIVFSPHPIDAAALQQALADGVSPNSSLVEAIKAAGPYFVLGSQLLAETLIAPVIIHYANKLHRAGRKITPETHEEQTLHDAAIKTINGNIDSLIKATAKAKAEIVAHLAAQEAAVAMAVRSYRDVNAAYARHAADSRDKFFSQYYNGVQQ